MHRTFRRTHRPSVRVRGDLNSRFRENTDGHTRASDLAIDLPHRLAGRARTAFGYIRIPRRQHRGSHHGRPCPQVTPCPLNTAAPPRRECARRGPSSHPPAKPGGRDHVRHRRPGARCGAPAPLPALSRTRAARVWPASANLGSRHAAVTPQEPAWPCRAAAGAVTPAPLGQLSTVTALASPGFAFLAAWRRPLSLPGR